LPPIEAHGLASGYIEKPLDTENPEIKQLGIAMKFAVLAACALGEGLLSPASAAEQFVGRWAVAAEVCGARGGDTSRNSALVATDTSLWWFDGYCRIGKMYKLKAVYVQAHCGAKGDVSVTLDAQGDRMKVTWDRKVEELRRCK
jgi:hypothetical protein